jgi:hypothetical protein
MISNVNGITNIRVVTFTIEELSERFYANGRHQCQIRISVLKQGQDSNWNMVKVPLSDREKRSLRPVAFSSSLNVDNLSMPAGWSSTKTRNIYDLGLINSTLSQPITRWLPVSAEEKIRESGDETSFCPECQAGENSVAEVQMTNPVEPFNVNNVPETFDFYISSSVTGTQQLMATMQFDVMNDGGMLINTMTLTTNMSDNNNNIFNSSIRLSAINPVIINNITPQIRTLQDREENVTKSDVHHQKIFLYTWTLPHNLRSMSRSRGDVKRFFYSLGNTHAGNRFLTQGRVYPLGTSRANAREYITDGTGCVWSYSYSVTVTDRQICADLLHVTGCSWTSGISHGSHDITMIDNYGTEHVFRISESDTGRTLSLNRVGN